MPINKPLLLVGAGGHAKVVVDALLSSGFAGGIEIRDDDVRLTGTTLLGFVVQTPVQLPGEARFEFHVAIGDNEARRRKFLAALAAGLGAHTICHPAASISAASSIAAGSFVAATARLGPCASVGRGTIINHGAIVDHDCRIGEFAHIAPSATLGGGVTIGDSVLVGAGAVVLPGKVIGAGATVGAGAVVTRDVGSGDTVVGTPARSHFLT